MFGKTKIAATAAVASLLVSPATANRCRLDNYGTFVGVDLWAENVHDIAGVCGGLWDNLKRFWQCTASVAYCGGIEDTHILNWNFWVPQGCNGGMIESAWWEATRNRFGAVTCGGY